MDEKEIIDLYWERSELAIVETDRQYGAFCRKVAFQILYDREDSEECVNDTYLRAWNVMPPQRPGRLAAFLGKITRNLALSRYRQNTAQKRGGGEVILALEELESCIPVGKTVEEMVDERLLVQTLNRFLGSLSAQNRRIFLQRYWSLTSVKDISALEGISESNVKMRLMRTRAKLRSVLEQEGLAI